MKKGMRMLAIVSASVLLISGCGTEMYTLTDDEETLITQYAAYAVGRHNIRQKDGMTSDKPTEETTTTESEQQSTQQPDTTPDANQNTQTPAASDATNNEADQYAEISLEKVLGYDSVLNISYKGYKLEDAYKEGNYFSVNAAEGNTLLVMNFTVKNSGKKSVKYDTSSLGYKFYGMFGSDKIAEKVTFSNKELTASTMNIKAGKKAQMVMLFELSKEQAANLTTEALLVDMDGTTYRVNLQK